MSHLSYLTHELYEMANIFEGIKKGRNHSRIMFDYEYWGNNTFDSRFNMAMEEYLLKRAAETGNAQIRFFSMSSPSVIIGYGQATDPIRMYDGTFNVARRLTGGSHVHFDEKLMAYTVAVPNNGQFKNLGDMRAYYAGLIANTIRFLGAEDVEVDNRASTINVDGKVIASHAMIWGVKSALLHGLLNIEPYDVDTVNRRVFLAQRKIGGNTYTEYSALQNLPAVSFMLEKYAPDIKGQARLGVIKDFVSNALLFEITKDRYKAMAVQDGVAAQAMKLLTEKYGTESWVSGRDKPFTKDEIEEIPGEELNGELKKKLGYCFFLQVKDRDFKKMAKSE
ncbi:MAG: hypothetical protein NT120_02800 [Candidatus Aenigmarchaeota archaeon]|nr:hypothetical protein [Candidatus Aenigmarchaeota archaeon]